MINNKLRTTTFNAQEVLYKTSQKYHNDNDHETHQGKPRG